MSKLWLVALLFLSSLGVPGQEETVTLDDLMQSADQWAKENLDEEALRALENVDRERVKRFFTDVEKQFRSQYVLDLAMLKQGTHLRRDRHAPARRDADVCPPGRGDPRPPRKHPT